MHHISRFKTMVNNIIRSNQMEIMTDNLKHVYYQEYACYNVLL